MTVPAPTTVAGVPAFILSAVSGFQNSAEYLRLDVELRTVPGLVLGQLTILLRRLQTEALERPSANRETAQTLDQAAEALEALAASGNHEIQNLVIVECLEHLHGAPRMREALWRRFGPATRALYLAWVDPGPPSKHGPGA